MKKEPFILKVEGKTVGVITWEGFEHLLEKMDIGCCAAVSRHSVDLCRYDPGTREDKSWED